MGKLFIPSIESVKSKDSLLETETTYDIYFYYGLLSPYIERHIKILHRFIAN